MTLMRRRFLQSAASAAGLSIMLRVARAEPYPSRPVHIIVPLAAAGTLDIIARLMGGWLSERLGQQFVIENRPGAGGNIGVEAVVRAPADGYTLLMIDVSAAINATLYDKLNFSFIRDIAPVGNVVRTPSLVAVHPKFPAKTISDFIVHAKNHPGKVSMAMAGNGSTSHIFGELFKMMTDVNLVDVPYRGGGPALIDMISGQVDVIFVPTPASIEYVRAGKLRALAVTSATRLQMLPDLPCVAEFVPGYEATSWYGIGATRNTPVEIIHKLNAEINAALADPKITARLADMGGTVLPGPSEDFARVIAEDTEKWGKVIRAANIKPE
jgi:tripartite-type tricarboxylate transporter receptor subunit TctC